MPPKSKKEVENVVESATEDPAVTAARAERDRIQGEERKAFERGETTDRRRVEAMEQVGLRVMQHEKEKRLDPTGWTNKTANKGPKVIFVKPLVGNRGIQQQTFRVPANDADVSVLLFKNGIRDEAVRLGHLAATFAPEHQKLYFMTKEIAVPDEYNCSLSSLGIFAGATVHVALEVPPTIPSNVR